MRIDGAIAAISKRNWGACDSVGDQSDYVMMISTELEDLIPVIRALLSPMYFTNFCDKLAARLLAVYNHSLSKCRRVNEWAAQQLLLDTHGVKTILSQVPRMGEQDAAATPNDDDPYAEPMETQGHQSIDTYNKLLGKEIGRVEILLKLVATPVMHLKESFGLLWSNGSREDLVQVRTYGRNEGRKEGRQIHECTNAQCTNKQHVRTNGNL